MTSARKIALLVFAVTALTACGKKGELLPPEKPPQSAPESNRSQP